jgi:hypothetical protein
LEQIAADKNRIRLHVEDQPEDVTLGIDVQTGISGVGLGTDSSKFSVDALQVTLLPRNFELIPLYYRKDSWDISLLKEPGLQFQLQPQPKDKGKDWETHVTLGVGVDLFNASIDPFEVALSGGAGYDFIGGNVAVTGSLGVKLTLAENLKVPILGAFGTNKLRLYGGVGIEGDIRVTGDTPSGFGGVNLGGGILFEVNPFEKKKQKQ